MNMSKKFIIWKKYAVHAPLRLVTVSIADEVLVYFVKTAWFWELKCFKWHFLKSKTQPFPSWWAVNMRFIILTVAANSRL